jgi:hypothetical protein
VTEQEFEDVRTPRMRCGVHGQVLPQLALLKSRLAWVFGRTEVTPIAEIKCLEKAGERSGISPAEVEFPFFAGTPDF